MKGRGSRLLVLGGVALFGLVVLSLVYALAPQQPGLDLARTKETEQRRYVATIRPLGEEPKVGPIGSWLLVLATASGEPVSGATVKVSGGMPDHNHGLPTDPQTSALPEPGQYRIDGLKFTMTGRWVLTLTIAAPPGDDRVTFTLLL